MAKANKGDIRPVYQQVGWEVLKKEAEKPEDEVWAQTDNPEIAELFSTAFKKEPTEK